MEIAYRIVNDDNDLNLIHAIASDEDGASVGNIDFRTYKRSSRVTLIDVKVEDEYRGLGIGTGMFEFARDFLSGIGVPVIDAKIIGEEHDYDNAIEFLNHLGFEQPTDSMCYVGVDIGKLLSNKGVALMINKKYPGMTLSELSPVQLRTLKSHLSDKGIDMTAVDIDYDCSCIIGSADNPESVALVAIIDDTWTFYYLSQNINKPIVFIKALSGILKKDQVDSVGCLFRARESYVKALEHLAVIKGPIIIQTLEYSLSEKHNKL